MADGMSLGAVVAECPEFVPLGSLLCTECGMRKQPMTADDLKDFPAPLNPRERRIIVLLCSGLINKEIADRMETTNPAIKKCLSAIFDKVEVPDRVALLIRMMKFKYEGV
jgi:DNA-binding NarL/FixJ family response regulator